MAVVRWEPFQELNTLRNLMDRLFDDRFYRPFRWSEEALLSVPLDVYEEDDKYVVEVALPGVRPAEVELSVHGNTLTIGGTLGAGEEEKRNYLLRERAHGKFSRTLTLPAELDADKVEARAADGVLRIALPKAAKYQPRKIAIKSA